MNSTQKSTVRTGFLLCGLLIMFMVDAPKVPAAFGWAFWVSAVIVALAYCLTNVIDLASKGVKDWSDYAINSIFIWFAVAVTFLPDLVNPNHARLMYLSHVMNNICLVTAMLVVVAYIVASEAD